MASTRPFDASWLRAQLPRPATSRPAPAFAESWRRQLSRLDYDALPDDQVIRRHVLGLADLDLAVDLGRVERRRNAQNDVVGVELGREVGLELYRVFDLALADLLDDRLDLERQVDVRRRAISHQLKLSVRRDEADRPIGVKFPELDALVKLTVIELDRLRIHAARGLLRRSIEHELVVQTKFALWRPAQIRPHEDLPVHVRSQHVAFRRHQQVDRLDHVHERLVLPILDV